jgi:tRNA(Ile)-lysidine synthase
MLIIALKLAIRMPDILSQVSNFMQAQGMPPPGSKILVALSGGADSVALTLILIELGYRPVAAHCNFGLRPEAMDEEAWVQRFAKALHIHIYMCRFSAADFDALQPDGIQQAARRLRYTFFEELMLTHSISACATAHHADDQLETQVMSFFRGNSPALLRSIPAVRGPYCRPLLNIGKRLLIDWLQARNQDWCHDSSNDQSDYLRNIVRNELFPVLDRINPSFRDRFQKQAARYAAQQMWMDAQLEATLAQFESHVGDERILQLDASRIFYGVPHVIVFIEWWLARQGFVGNEIDEILKFLDAPIGSIAQFGEWELLHDRGCLRMRPKGATFTLLPLELNVDAHAGQEINYAGDRISLHQVPIPNSYKTGEHHETHWMDKDRLRLPIRLRIWEPGDRFVPVGLHGTKRVSDILIDQKRDRFAKERAWVLEDADGIILLSGYRIAARVAIDQDSKACLRLERIHSM